MKIKNLTVSELRKELRKPKTSVSITVRVTEDDEASLPVTKSQVLRLFEEWDGGAMTAAVQVGDAIII